MWELLPTFSPSFPACFLFLQVPRPLPRSLSSPPLSPSWSERLFTIQTKHHQPPADCHQHLLFPVTSSPSMRNTTCPNSLEIPLPSSYILANLCPGHPTRSNAAPRGISSIPYCSTLSQLPKYLALLYLIPKEPINSEYPTFSWIHSPLFSNTTSIF